MTAIPQANLIVGIVAGAYIFGVCSIFFSPLVSKRLTILGVAVCTSGLLRTGSRATGAAYGVGMMIFIPCTHLIMSTVTIAGVAAAPLVVI